LAFIRAHFVDIAKITGKFFVPSVQKDMHLKDLYIFPPLQF